MTTSDNIAAIEKALKGVTPGRWGQFHPSYAPEAEGTPFSTWDTSHDLSAIKDGKKFGRIATFKHSADAAYVDACSPDRISTLLAEARKAEAMEREIAEKDARITALEAGLRAFAECAGEWDGEPESLHVFFEWNDENTPVPSLPVADFRRARTLLNGGSDAQG